MKGKRMFSKWSAITLTIGALVATECHSSDPYEMSADSIGRHVYVLAADSMEGRKVGQAGEWRAAQYIQSVFRSSGVQPGGSDGYLHEFGFVSEIAYGETVRLVVNGTVLQLDKEFRPLPQSASGSFEFGPAVWVDFGITTDSSEGAYDDFANKDVDGKAVIIKRFAPEVDDNPHVDFEKYSSLTSKITNAIDHGVGAIIFITPANKDDTLVMNLESHVTPKDIPIIFLRRAALQKLQLEVNQPYISSAVGEIELIPVRDTGCNVVGRIDGQTDTTIVIGAHFDHLGWGGGNSLYTGAEPMIHNGADDNASGTSALLELARYYGSRTNKPKYSLVFCAFSGEEEGLLGSNNFVRSNLIETSAVRLMINMDMLGDLHAHDTTVAIFGVGSALEFKSYFDSLKWAGLKMTFQKPGTGPSDQTSFYNCGIPVLYFFTGAHERYHKPTDDPETVDIAGIAKVAQLVRHTIDYFEEYPGGLTFQKTVDPNAGGQSASYSVTLGIMPDYVAEVEGVKIDGVLSDRPAERAGMLRGDIIIRMGVVKIGDIHDYMNGLSKFRKGDSTTAVIVRGADTLSLPVIFE